MWQLKYDICDKKLMCLIDIKIKYLQITDIYCAITVGGQVFFGEKDALKVCLLILLLEYNLYLVKVIF